MAYPLRDFSIRELKNFTNYKHVCIDNSIIHRYLIKDIFIRIQRRIPAAVLPNQITLAGLAAMLLSFVLTYAFDRTLTRAPWPLVLANLGCLAVYFTADGVDGIHARATRRCSPIGYLLDHGVDSLACMSVAVGVASTLRIGASRLFLLLLLNIYAIFYFGALQHKYTGVFALNYISGCSEGLVSVMLLHAASLFSTLPRAVASGRYTVFSTVLTARKMEIFLACTLLYNCVELSAIVIPRLDRARSRQFAASAYSLALLLLIFVTGFVYRAAAGVWPLLAVFAIAFSLCYVEETLSIVLCSAPEWRVFATASLLVGACSVATGVGASLPPATVLAALSIFGLRAGSIVRNFCRRTGHKFVTG